MIADNTGDTIYDIATIVTQPGLNESIVITHASTSDGIPEIDINSDPAPIIAKFLNSGFELVSIENPYNDFRLIYNFFRKRMLVSVICSDKY